MAALLRSSCAVLSRQFPFSCLARKSLKPHEKTVVKRIGAEAGFSSASPNTATTTPVKDVILYSHENRKFHRNVNTFGFMQLLFWLSLAEYSTSLLDKPDGETNADEETTNQRKSSEDQKLGKVLPQIFAGVGLVTLGACWTYSSRCIKNIVLRKGGKGMTLITYGPFGKLRYLDVPLEKVSAVQPPSSSLKKLPVKVEGYAGRFLLDMRGEIRNRPLFDATVGFKA